MSTVQNNPTLNGNSLQQFNRLSQFNNGGSLNSLSEIQIPNLSIPQSKMIINPNGNSLIMDYLTGKVSPQVNPFMQYRPKGL